MYYMTRTNESIIFDILSFTVAKIKPLRKNYIDYKYHIQYTVKHEVKHEKTNSLLFEKKKMISVAVLSQN